MTTQTEALKMALEVMRNQGDVSVDEWIATENAIKEALAQQSNEQAINPKTTFNEVERGLQQSRMAIATLDSITTEQRQQINEPLLQAQLFLMAVSKAVADTESQQSNEQVELITKEQVLADVIAMLEKQHDWLTRTAAINLVAGLYGNADVVLSTHPPVPTAQPKEPEQEPLETLAYKADYWRRMHDEVRAELIKSLNAKPEQKPVAWELGEEVYWGDSPELSDYVRKEGTPLYTTPPQRTWVGLTDKEAHELWESTDSDDDWELMKRTEAKLKEKNS